jgi:exonuclease III
MNQNNLNRSWCVLSWNIRGINSQAKWDHIRNKISESAAQIVCLQETKREVFDQAYISKFCPRYLNKFAFVPSTGASGGLLVCWNANIFHGSVTFALSQAISIEFTSLLSGASFHLTNIYGPCDSSEKAAFINWLYNLDTSLMVDWLLVGDFNLIRSPEDRNKPGMCLKCFCSMI